VVDEPAELVAVRGVVAGTEDEFVPGGIYRRSGGAGTAQGCVSEERGHGVDGGVRVGDCEAGSYLAANSDWQGRAHFFGLFFLVSSWYGTA
jgi:hypothetical protein